MVVAEGSAQTVVGPLWPEEEAHIARAVEGRRAEFTAGRVLARRAIAQLGGEDFPIPPGSRNMPIWPAGFVGSISHAHGQVAAAVAKHADIRSVGIDIENMNRFRHELEKKIASDEEIHLNFDGLPADARQMALAIMFSGKEAFYKCQYPITGQYLGFHDAHLVIDHKNRTFGLDFLAEAPPLTGRHFAGRYGIRGGTIYSAMVID